MTTPEPLAKERPKAYRAFNLYVQQGEERSMRKLARYLNCSCQNLAIWAKKYRWQARIATQRQCECEQRIRAEEQAIETVAVVSEASRANAANRAFAVGAKLIGIADKFAESAHDLSLSLAERKLAAETAARFYGVAKDVVMSGGVGGAATGYQVPPVSIQVVSQYVDERGNPASAPEPITSVEQAQTIIDEYEAQVRCSQWSKQDVDATPVEQEKDGPSTPSADYVEHAPNPDLTIDHVARIPSRVETTPTADGRGIYGSYAQPGTVPILGL